MSKKRIGHRKSLLASVMSSESGDVESLVTLVNSDLEEEIPDYQRKNSRRSRRAPSLDTLDTLISDGRATLVIDLPRINTGSRMEQVRTLMMKAQLDYLYVAIEHYQLIINGLT